MAEKVVYLNLQEQVGKNKRDIEEIRSVTLTLERFGVRVVGEEVSVEDLPDPLTYTGQYGDAYLIGEEHPFDMYIFTQPSAGETDPKWFNIGPFPAPGEQGPEGQQGPTGPQGTSTKWRVGQVNPSILTTDKINDLYLNTSTGMVYQFNGSVWIPYASIRGPEGQQGPTGPQGETGPRGPIGQRGPIGPAGSAVEVIGVLDDVASLPSPDDVARNAAFIVAGDLYIIIEGVNQLVWYNAGEFTGVAGEAAGFGSITATASASDTPTVYVATSGPDTAKNFAFTFGIPVFPGLDNTEPSPPSTTKGYTQAVIYRRTPTACIKQPSDLGLAEPARVGDIMLELNMNGRGRTDVFIGSIARDDLISDGPTTSGVLKIFYGEPLATPLWFAGDGTNDIYYLREINYQEQDGVYLPIPTWGKIAKDNDLYNPNILINPDFSINQRGQASYAVSGKFTVDDWILDAGGALTVDSNGITLLGGIRQFIEGGDIGYWNKNLTISITTDSGTTSASAKLPAAAPGSNTTLVNMEKDASGVNAIVAWASNKLAVVINSTTSTKVYNVKLEIGSTPTKFLAPNKIDELIRCQRYYWAISSGDNFTEYCFGNTISASGFILGIDTPVKMRITPTVTISSPNDFTIRYGSDKDNNYNLLQSRTSTLSLRKYNGTKAILSGTVVGNFGDWFYSPCTLRSYSNNSKIEFDAGIYE